MKVYSYLFRNLGAFENKEDQDEVQQPIILFSLSTMG